MQVKQNNGLLLEDEYVQCALFKERGKGELGRSWKNVKK